MHKFTVALIGATALSLGACASEADEETVDETLVDDSYDADAASLDEVIEEPVVVEDEVASEPAAPAVDEIDTSDVVGTEAETEDVVGL